jgi:protein disulfide-isomerase A6
MFLGYIRDTTSHDILTSLGIYNSADTTRDATRAVVWKVGADKPELVEFEGMSISLDRVPANDKVR